VTESRRKFEPLGKGQKVQADEAWAEANVVRPMPKFWFVGRCKGQAFVIEARWGQNVGLDAEAIRFSSRPMLRGLAPNVWSRGQKQNYGSLILASELSVRSNESRYGINNLIVCWHSILNWTELKLGLCTDDCVNFLIMRFIIILRCACCYIWNSFPNSVIENSATRWRAYA